MASTAVVPGSLSLPGERPCPQGRQQERHGVGEG